MDKCNHISFLVHSSQFYLLFISILFIIYVNYLSQFYLLSLCESLFVLDQELVILHFVCK